MGMQQIAPGVYQVGVRGVNSFIIDHDGVTLIDTGIKPAEREIKDALRKIGRSPADVTNILISHYHWDHVGTLREMKEASGAKIYAASGDADLMRTGGEFPKMHTRGFQGPLIAKFARFNRLEPMPVDEEVSDGDKVAVGDGVNVIGTPGHTRGHVAFLWPEQGGVLFAADAASHLLGRLQPFPFGQDLEQTNKSFTKLADLDFEVAVFGHGSAIKSGASARFRRVASKYL